MMATRIAREHRAHELEAELQLPRETKFSGIVDGSVNFTFLTHLVESPFCYYNCRDTILSVPEDPRSSFPACPFADGRIC